MQNHLKTAQEWGARQALEQAGYKSAEEVRQAAVALGLIPATDIPPTGTRPSR
jgi:hypothetical protein